VDVSGLMLNQSLRAGELTFDKNKIRLLTDPTAVLAHVVALRVEEEKPAEVAVAGVAPAEPEVIKKGKKEVEGEEGAEAAPEKAEKPEKKK
jgi:large subunit ribosomal protein L25